MFASHYWNVLMLAYSNTIVLFVLLCFLITTLNKGCTADIRHVSKDVMWVNVKEDKESFGSS